MYKLQNYCRQIDYKINRRLFKQLQITWHDFNCCDLYETRDFHSKKKSYMQAHKIYKKISQMKRFERLENRTTTKHQP